MESEMDDLACQWIADVCAPTEVAGIDDLRDGTPCLALLLALAGGQAGPHAAPGNWGIFCEKACYRQYYINASSNVEGQAETNVKCETEDHTKSKRFFS